MRVKSIEIKDILSIKDFRLDFADSGLVLVEGWNYDANRANGAGKTAIFNSLSFGLFDKMPRKITSSQILRRGAKNGMVIVELESGGDTYKVIRHRPKGVEFYKNGAKEDFTQEEWETKLRMNYDQFLLTLYNAQITVGGLSPRFLLVNDSDKKTFLLQLLNLAHFSACKKKADEAVSRFEAAVSADLNSISSTQSKIEAYKESIVDDVELKTQITELQLEILVLQSKIATFSEVPKPDLSKYHSLEDGIKTKIASFNTAKAQRSMLHDQYRKQMAKIRDFDGDKECNECGSILDTNEAEKVHAQHQEKFKAEAAATKLLIDKCDAILANENEVLEVLRKLNAKKNQETSEYDAAKEQITKLSSSLRIKSNLIESADLKLTKNTDLLSKIKVLQDTCQKLRDTIAINKRNIELYKTVVALYSPTGAQAYVLDSVIDCFNETVKEYIDIVWPNASYTLNSYKENVRGDVVAKFSETLIMNGEEVSIGSLSGGEFKALSLCVDFAMLDVLEKQFGISLNPVILDEPFDGLDAVGRELVVDLLTKLSVDRQIFVVDHASESKAMFSNIIKVEKRNGQSFISVEA